MAVTIRPRSECKTGLSGGNRNHWPPPEPADLSAVLSRSVRWQALPASAWSFSTQNSVSEERALIATDHSAFDYASIVKHAPLIIDTRNATKAIAVGREKIVKA